MVLRMIASNETDSLQRLDAHEQRQLDEAIAATLRLPEDLKNFGTMVRHCPVELQEKLYRWHGDGMHARLFSQQTDPMEKLTQRVVAFNLASIKDDPVALPLVMSEIFYRVTRAFEDPKYRAVPKWLDVDEAHALLRTPYICEYIIRGVRTWGKWLAGIGLWTQGADEFAKIADWPVLRSAASTFFFMADPAMDRALYKSVFDVTDGECDEIKGLVPQREAFIVQREAGVSKKIILEVEPEQYVISTSKPTEAEARRRNINLYGFKAGIEKTIEELRLNETDKRYEVAV
jgi:type IV secretion system protein VirB4